MAASSAAVTLRQYHDANASITAVFDCMGELINTLDADNPKGAELLNARELFPAADTFIRNVTDATYQMHEAYTDYIQNGYNPSGPEAKIIDREGQRIFREIGAIVMQARKLHVHPISQTLSQTHQPKLDALQTQQIPSKKRHTNNTLRAKQGQIQTALFEEARRLGPHYGSHFLLGVEDTFLATIDMMHSIHDAGVNIDMHLLPSAETRPDMWSHEAPLLAQNVEVDTHIGNLLKKMHLRRQQSENTWNQARAR